jgi:hypothetical protein
VADLATLRRLERRRVLRVSRTHRTPVDDPTVVTVTAVDLAASRVELYPALWPSLTWWDVLRVGADGGLSVRAKKEHCGSVALELAAPEADRG